MANKNQFVDPNEMVTHKVTICPRCNCTQTLPLDLQECPCPCHPSDRTSGDAERELLNHLAVLAVVLDGWGKNPIDKERWNDSIILAAELRDAVRRYRAAKGSAGA